jgi:S-adenosylmethionine synthetase
MIRTAESVKRGHPDKVCDQIADKILDECLIQDKTSKVALEVMGGHGIVTVTGEVTTCAYVDIRKIVKQVYKDIGYTNEIGVQVNVVSQSPDIFKGVKKGGAGDQGVMVGYACSENKGMIPQELMYSRYITGQLETLQEDYDFILPDGKAQITLKDDKITRIVISNQTTDEQKLKEVVKKEILSSLKKEMTKGCRVYINPTGKFEQGGFDADSGVTGRKIVCDAYGPRVPVGGGAFSGKDPSKVDRSAAYMARKIAVDYLKKYKAKEVFVYLAYSIGKAQPMQATAKICFDDKTIFKEIKEYDLTPNGIIDFLNLKEPIYYATAKNGHFGQGFRWDK